VTQSVIVNQREYRTGPSPQVHQKGKSCEDRKKHEDRTLIGGGQI
jgi:hypothetical protein